VRDDILKLRETMDEQLKVPNPADPPRYQVVEVDQRVMKADLATLEEEIRWGKYCWFHMTPESLRQYKRKGSELGELCVSTMPKAFAQIHDKYKKHLKEQREIWAKEFAANLAAKEKERLEKEKAEEEARLK
jgi:hypothetical protein